MPEQSQKQKDQGAAPSQSMATASTLPAPAARSNSSILDDCIAQADVEIGNGNFIGALRCLLACVRYLRGQS